MNDEKIIELAAQFDDDSPEFAMSTEAVIAFARALIDARLDVIERVKGVEE